MVKVARKIISPYNQTRSMIVRSLTHSRRRLRGKKLTGKIVCRLLSSSQGFVLPYFTLVFKNKQNQKEKGQIEQFDKKK
jgi:hypothetical protein